MADQTEDSDERAPLLDANGDQDQRKRRNCRTKTFNIALVVAVVLIVCALVGGIVWYELPQQLSDDPNIRARQIMDTTPLIDGHNDMPIFLRFFYRGQLAKVDLNDRLFAHTDIPRLRQGKMGAQFWSIFTACPESKLNYTMPNNAVRDTLEQIDITKRMINAYPDAFGAAYTVNDIRRVFSQGKIASLMGVEGSHMLGNSLAPLRIYYELGARYLTLTHTCNTIFADSANDPLGFQYFGLSNIGKVLIKEMNRIGMMVDLSHVSEDVMHQSIELSEAPVIFSHSSAKAVFDHPRNVPDDVLKSLKRKDGVVMINFYPQFIKGSDNASIEDVADHVEHVVSIAGWEHVGLGSDFNGITSVPKGLEDVSKYPDLIALLIRRGGVWSEPDAIRGLLGENLLRVFSKVEAVSQSLHSETAREDIWQGRDDL